MSRHVTRATIWDVEGTLYTKEQIEEIIAGYPEHEREARAKGIPQLGSGRIFPIAEELLKVEPFEVPEYWVQIGGIDFGYDHPTAAVRIAWDRDADVMYVTHTHRVKQQITAFHASALRAWGDWLPWAWPHDGFQHDKQSGVATAEAYRSEGLNMLYEQAKFEDGSNGVEAGVLRLLQRMETGRLKVFSHLSDWFDEFRLYHRKDGKIVKEFDDLMAATRYAEMCLRFASYPPDDSEYEDDQERDSVTGY